MESIEIGHVVNDTNKLIKKVTVVAIRKKLSGHRVSLWKKANIEKRRYSNTKIINWLNEKFKRYFQTLTFTNIQNLIPRMIPEFEKCLNCLIINANFQSRPDRQHKLKSSEKSELFLFELHSVACQALLLTS